MITTAHGYIRSTDPDDAAILARLYDPACPRAALLDLRREPVFPTVDEIRQMLVRPPSKQGRFYTIEDKTGAVRGFCGIRGSNTEAAFGEVHALFLDPADYAGPQAGEVADFLFERTFIRQRLQRILAHALETETALAGFLRAHGFASCGVQREVLYTQGRWHNLETLARRAAGE
ncbi:MAG: N-acetyltransferase family protein [Candidatus Hydrogenedentota bacterium]